jgi:hypothetical protein
MVLDTKTAHQTDANLFPSRFLSSIIFSHQAPDFHFHGEARHGNAGRGLGREGIVIEGVALAAPPSLLDRPRKSEPAGSNLCALLLARGPYSE